MKEYDCYALFTVTKHLGTVQADSAVEAANKAFDEFGIDVSVCHQCSKGLGDFNLESVTAEGVDDINDLVTVKPMTEQLVHENARLRGLITNWIVANRRLEEPCSRCDLYHGARSCTCTEVRASLLAAEQALLHALDDEMTRITEATDLRMKPYPREDHKEEE